jgi:hypothetical protein
MRFKGPRIGSVRERWTAQGLIGNECVRLLDAGERLSLEVVDSLRMNSYERFLLTPLYSDEALIAHTLYAVRHCEMKVPPDTYNEAVWSMFAPYLADRLAGANADLRRLQETRALEVSAARAAERARILAAIAKWGAGSSVQTRAAAQAVVDLILNLGDPE